MKKLLLILLIPFSLFSQSTLIFSEYGEGSSNNKWVEIYNPTFMNESLDEYRYNFCWNGCDSMQWEFSIPFDSGYILLPGETYLLVHYNADTILLNSANQTTNILSNGNDVAGLYYLSFDAIVDIIGVFDTSGVNTGWDVDGVVNATQNHTMTRKPDVCGGNIGDWSLSDGSSAPSQWIVGVIDDFSNLNTHTSECINSTFVPVLDPFKRKIIEVRDVLGRKTKFTINQPLFYIYDDGTVKKRFVLE
jgi:predicted extracellular nuclease